jgi:hypothetical protein
MSALGIFRGVPVRVLGAGLLVLCACQLLLFTSLLGKDERAGEAGG